jgi:hypothetical protein
MSRNGTGTYNLPAGNPVVTGTVIASTWANSTLTDIASALTGSVAADGQTPMTGDLDMNTNKVINVEPATVAGNAVEYAQFVAATTTNVNITGGTINGTSIGETTRSSGKFTTLNANSTLGVTGATTLSSTLDVTGVATFAANSQFNGTGALKLPVGTTAQQPTPALGMVRYNSTLNQYEGYINSAWAGLGGSAGGSNTQVQYNNSGALAGSANLTFNGTTLAFPSISDGTTTTSTTNCIKGSTRAWVDFNGTTATIRSSFNVSSVTRNATGDYTVTFTTSMSNANYAAIGNASGIGDVPGSSNLNGTISTYSVTTSAYRFQTAYRATNLDPGNSDVADCRIAIFST